jgi:hypothetical protein
MKKRGQLRIGAVSVGLILLGFLFAPCGVGEPDARYYYNLIPGFDIRGEVYVSEIHWAGSIDNQGQKDDPLDCFIEIHNNAPVPLNLSGWCIRISGSVERLIIIPRGGAIGGGDFIVRSGGYLTIGRHTNGAFDHLDVIMPDFAIPTSPFTIRVQDPGGRTSDTVDFEQRSYLPVGTALPLVRRSAVRTENFFGGDDGGSYDSWEEYREFRSWRSYQNIRENYRARVFASPGDR